MAKLSKGPSSSSLTHNTTTNQQTLPTFDIMPLLYVRNYGGPDNSPLTRWTINFENIVTAKYLIIKVFNELEP